MAQVDVTAVPITVTETILAGFPVSITAAPIVVTDMLGATRTPYVYVVDSGNNRVQAFDYNGNFKFSFGSFGSGNGQFNNPYGINTDGTYVYVTDRGNNRVQIFTMFGVYVGKFGTAGTADGQFNSPMGVAVDDRYIWVIDSGNNRFQIFELTSYTHIYSLGTYGSGVDQFDAPTDCEVDSTYFYIYDAGNSRWLQYPKTFYLGAIGDGQLPALTGAAVGGWPSGRGNGELPSFLISSPGAMGYVGRVGIGAGILPAMETDGAGYAVHIGIGAGILPAMSIIATGLTAHMGAGDGIMPAMTISADGFRATFGTGAGILPALVISASGYVVLANSRYAGLVMNMRNKALTTYSGYTFNSLTGVGGKTYGANANGIFPLEGDNDNGVPINAHITTGTLDLHDPSVQRLVDAWLSLRIPGSATLTVIEDEDTDDPEVYEISGEDEKIHDERIPLARGHKGRFAVFRVDNIKGSDFEIAGMSVRTRDLHRPR